MSYQDKYINKGPKRKREDVVREARASLRASFEKAEALRTESLAMLALKAKADPLGTVTRMRAEVCEVLAGIINAAWLLTEETEP